MTSHENKEFIFLTDVRAPCVHAALPEMRAALLEMRTALPERPTSKSISVYDKKTILLLPNVVLSK